ncbi:DUF4280 domain-containing protein [Flavobacterium sp. S87F.05.LMB.W.Kidney.N]|uniref:DUF4280 domain-containing protein n=1 Tax=Flavobacterium sp. S87F.05.LMB.W.Kidney.N TaxID=1278758 RepID=UPI001066F1D3|nr:DUF4280 domain-containing protein [Flavobacterium sp. S87F.05.LMB.W.Kidney.N]TDX11202.1 uncharacterized protein DUF4280 [Flavobacterium sp. S87F.05.LMB.W.Kidney.N]
MGVKYVCNGASCTCDQGSAPSTVDVNSQNTIFIQEKLMATENDITFKNPFGTCKLKNNNPCNPLIIAKWETPSNNVYGGNKKALLETSQLKCNVGTGGKINITNSLQTGSKIVIFDNYSPPVVTPLKKEIVSVNWKNNDLENEINSTNIGDKVSLVVKTKNYNEGETVVIVIDEANGKNIKSNTKLVKFSGEVNVDGFAVLKEEISIENEN